MSDNSMWVDPDGLAASARGFASKADQIRAAASILKELIDPSLVRNASGADSMGRAFAEAHLQMGADLHEGVVTLGQAVSSTGDGVKNVADTFGAADSNAGALAGSMGNQLDATSAAIPETVMERSPEYGTAGLPMGFSEPLTPGLWMPMTKGASSGKETAASSRTEFAETHRPGSAAKNLATAANGTARTELERANDSKHTAASSRTELKRATQTTSAGKNLATAAKPVKNAAASARTELKPANDSKGTAVAAPEEFQPFERPQAGDASVAPAQGRPADSTLPGDPGTGYASDASVPAGQMHDMSVQAVQPRTEEPRIPVATAIPETILRRE